MLVAAAVGEEPVETTTPTTIIRIRLPLELPAVFHGAAVGAGRGEGPRAEEEAWKIWP